MPSSSSAKHSSTLALAALVVTLAPAAHAEAAAAPLPQFSLRDADFVPADRDIDVPTNADLVAKIDFVSELAFFTVGGAAEELAVVTLDDGVGRVELPDLPPSTAIEVHIYEDVDANGEKDAVDATPVRILRFATGERALTALDAPAPPTTQVEKSPLGGATIIVSAAVAPDVAAARLVREDGAVVSVVAASALRPTAVLTDFTDINNDTGVRHYDLVVEDLAGNSSSVSFSVDLGLLHGCAQAPTGSSAMLALCALAARLRRSRT